MLAKLGNDTFALLSIGDVLVTEAAPNLAFERRLGRYCTPFPLRRS
jgi:hypothetical protein